MIKKLSSNDSVFIRNLFLTTILGGIIGILNYLFNIFVARYTDQIIFGIFSSALGIIYLVQIPASSIQSAVTKSVAKNKKYNLNYFKWYSFAIFSVLGIIFSVLFFLARGTIAGIANIPSEIVLFLAISLFFAFISPVGKGFLLGYERITTINLILLAETILKFVMGWIAIKMGGSLPLLILANSTPALLSTVAILPLIKFKEREKKKVKIDFKELSLITLSFLFLNGPFILSLPLVNTSFRAEFSAISILGKLVYFAAVMTASVLFARLTNEKIAKNQKRSLIISLGLSVSIGLFISLALFLFGDLIITLTVGEQYLMVSQHIGVFGLCMTAFAFVYMAANFFISKEYYNYIYILVIGTAMQIASFIFRNDSLEMVIQNQAVVYGLMSFFTMIYLLFKLKTIKNGEEEKE